MKTRLTRIVTFCCMVVILGLQNLLQGSWKVQEVKPIRVKPAEGV